MAKYLSNRQKNFKIGISSYTENSTVLEVTGNVGIGTTDSEGRSLYVIGDGQFDGNLKVTGIATFGTGTIIVDGDNNIITVGTGVTISSIDGIDAPSIRVDTLNADNLFVTGITTLASNGGITTTGGNLYVGQNLQVAGTSNFIGTAIFRGGTIGIGDSISDNIDVGGEFISSLVPSDDGLYDLGIDEKRWRNVRLSGLTETTDLYVSGIGTIATLDTTIGTINYLSGTNVSYSGIGTIETLDTTTGTIDYLTNTNINTSGIATIGGVKISSGIVTAVSGVVTYYGDQVIGTPTGGSFRAGAYEPQVTDFTKDSIDELNYILGKLVPNQPDTINGVSLFLTGTASAGRLCAGFSPINNTGGDLTPSAGTQYIRNTDNTITTTYLTEYGPGDSGTVTGYVNSVGVGTTTLNVSFGIYAVKSDNGTYGSLQIANDKDAADSTRNAGIASLFYEVYDVRLIDAPSPDGFNKAYITQGANQTQKAYWYEDPSTVSAPIISFSGVTAPSSGSHTVSYSSGVPHYTQSTNNNFTYVLSVENATGDMYTQNTFLNSDGQTSGFQDPGSKSYTDFAGGTNPPTRNYGVGSAVTTLISQTPRDLHLTLTSNHFTTFDATTPYGTHSNQRVSYATNINIMGTTARTDKIDEDNILVSSLGTGSGNATRTNAGSGDNPTPIYTAWNPSITAATYEAIVRGGVLRHDQTNYSTGYLPVGPDYSSGRSGAQYFQIEIIRSNVSQFNISYTGSCAGCWVSMPDNSTWTTSLSGVNGWADMFQAYRGSGVPTTAEPGCSSGGVMDTDGGTFTCVFGTESSSNDSNNRILIRWKLTSGQSITAMSLSNT